MIAVIQRVSSASVSLKKETNTIGLGFVVLLGVSSQDDAADVSILVKKISKLRIMADDQGSMNLSLGDVNGELLIISQFTLLGNTRSGNRPSFTNAAPPKEALELYNSFVTQIKETGIQTKTGFFGRYMRVEIVNDGPTTIIINTKEKKS